MMAYVVATQTIHLAGGVSIVKGQRVNTKEAVVKNAAAGLFVSDAVAAESYEPVTHRAVESATAAPGETRSVVKPAKKVAKKKPRAKVTAKK